MKSQALLLTLVATTLSSAIPKPSEDDHKNRVVDRDLSDKQHYNDHDDPEHADHNNGYDHEAFLGHDDARTFDDLSPDEAKQRLGIIFDKIDKDGDGVTTEAELVHWIKHVQNRYVSTDTERQWKEHDIKDDRISWDDYQKRTYGFMEEEDEEDEEDGYSYKEMMKRDQRRWNVADRDGDGFLNKEEFADFLHPEDAEHMRDIVVQETIEDIDKDKDGFISAEEYIGDMWPDHEGGDEPDWVKTEREQFHSYRDKNSDGKMDSDEVREWIIPPDYDHSEAEAKHLIYEADADRDDKLSKQEVLSKYDLFVGSQATDFGEALARHDEF